MTAPQITTPGTPPDPLAPQPTFRATFYAYLQKLVTAFGQANTAFDWVNTTAETVDVDATAVEASRQQVVSLESDASDSAALAEKWASEDEDVAVAGGEFSSKHYSLKSSGFADAAEAHLISAQAVAALVGEDAGLPAFTGNGGLGLAVNVGETAFEFVPLQSTKLRAFKETYTASGKWIKRQGTVFASGHIVGGGASGEKFDSNTNRGGGGGEGLQFSFLANELPESVDVVIGLGGAGVTVDGLGNDGGDTEFGDLLTARGGKSTGESGGGQLPSQPIGASYTLAGGGYSGGGGGRSSSGGDAGIGGGGGGSRHQFGRTICARRKRRGSKRLNLRRGRRNARRRRRSYPHRHQIRRRR